MIDISYPIKKNMAIYPGNPSFSIRRVQALEAGDGADVSEIVIGTHTGTHIDTPAHFIEGGETMDKITLDRMNGKAKIYDVTGHDDIDEDMLEKADICNGDIVLFKTDNSDYWECDTILENYVTLTYDGAEYLARLGVKLIGIDYLTIERPRDKRIQGKSIHKTLLENGIIICEGLRLKEVSASQYVFRCLPLNIIGADGCPVRAVLDEI